MSRFGTVNLASPASLVTRVVQASLPEDLQARANAAIQEIYQLQTYLVIAITLAAGGDGDVFTVTIEAALTTDIVQGGFADDPEVICYMASEAEALAVARGAAGPTGVFADSQVAGGSKGTQFMGLLVLGTPTLITTVGPTGPRGVTGATGPTGSTGPTGRGPTGPTGPDHP